MLTSGLLIVGHGTRDDRGAGDFLRLVDLVRDRMVDAPVQPAFLEFARPTIEEGFAGLVAQGVRDVVVAPLLLFAADHVRRDIPAAVAQVASRHPGVRACQVNHLGCHPRVVELSMRRYEEALSSQTTISPHESLLLLVGRGSRDPRATEEMLQFADLRRQGTTVGTVETCFTAMERPLLTEMLPEVARRPVRRIVVQPHLLFSGYLIRQIRSVVEQARDTWSEIDWILTEPLGGDPELAEAVVEIAAQAGELAVTGRRRLG